MYFAESDFVCVQLIKSAMKDLDFSVELDTPFDDYVKAMEPVEAVKENVNPKSLRPIFDELVRSPTACPALSRYV